jgi:hypothetical protein
MYNLRIALLLLGASSLAAATEVWRWVDQDGVVHLSDKQVPGATRVQLQPTTPPKPAFTAAPTRALPRPVESTKLKPGAPYSSCDVIEPADDAAFDAPEFVQLSVRPLPALRPGDRVAVTLDGASVADWTPGSLTYVLQQPERGTHSIAIRITSAQGQLMCASKTSTFHVRQPSLKRPGRKP